MYRVMIVDDEPWAVTGIRNAFDWKAYGFEIIAEATNSEKAFELICSEQPDVVFTDIRMPKYNGIDLIRMTKDRNIDTEYVVVSGYAEFVYAREALRYGALDYCLKPVDLTATGTLLKKISEHLSSKRISRNGLILEALMSNDKTGRASLEQHFQRDPKPFWYALIAYTRDESDHNGKSGLLGEHTVLEIKMGSRKILYIISLSADLEISDDSEWMSEYTSVGISSRADSLDNTARLIKEADIAASKPFVHSCGGIFFYNDNKKIIKPYLRKLQNELEQKDFQGLCDTIVTIREAFSKNNLGMAEAVFLWNQIISIINSDQNEEENDIGLEYLNYLELKEKFLDLDSLCSFFTGVFEQMGKQNGPVVDEGEILAYFYQLVEFVRENYAKELYLKELAARFFLNPYYCCRLFNKVLNTTYTRYVTGVRIEKACELLKNTELSVEDVAIKVGYADYYYFNKVFKKQCGITPAKYRRK